MQSPFARQTPSATWAAPFPQAKSLDIFGTPGNDLGCYLDGGRIEVFGNGQDQVGNTMNDGAITIHGRVGDAAGYAMRGAPSSCATTAAGARAST